MASLIRCHPVASVVRSWKQLHKGTQSRCFSSSAHQEQRITRAREQFFRWLNSRGQVYREPAPGTTNYLTAPNKGKIGSNTAVGEEREVAGESVTPFILNPTFISQPILSEEMREDIWKRIMQDGQSVREVSATLGVDMRRVGAVVRLKEIEKEWLRMGKPLARPYANAVMSMLPKGKDQHDGHFEPINDISLHAATSPQIFYPTSESRHFTRSDAARVFDENLLPADNRIPHPQMIHMRKDIEAGYSPEEVKARQQAREKVEETRREARRQKKMQKEAEAVKMVDTQRWRFRFTDVNVDDAGKTGRGEKGVGWRYGAPLMDRKKGMVKIPTKVE